MLNPYIYAFSYADMVIMGCVVTSVPDLSKSDIWTVCGAAPDVIVHLPFPFTGKSYNKAVDTTTATFIPPPSNFPQPHPKYIFPGTNVVAVAHVNVAHERCVAVPQVDEYDAEFINDKIDSLTIEYMPTVNS
jgi:hypothetical protein